MDHAKTQSPVPPVVARRPVVRTHHGDALEDPYAWLREADDPEVVALLEAENAYADAVTQDSAPLTEAIFEEIRRRTKETDLSVPVRYRGWWYYTRTREGQQYGIVCRVPVDGETRPDLEADTPPPGEQVLVDGNVEAAGGDYFALGAVEVDLSGTRIAFAVDRAGDERFDVTVRDVTSGEVIDDTVRGIGYGLVWSNDDRYLFYTRVDDAWRQFEVWRHEVGSPAEQDVRIFHEADEMFTVGIDASRDGRWMVLGTGSRTSTEMHLLDLDDPCGALHCVRPRTPDLEYDVEPAGDHLLVVHNAERVDFAVSSVPVAAVLGSTPDEPAAWQEWWTPQEGERVVGVDAFAGFVAVSLRTGGLPGVTIVRHGVDGRPVAEGELVPVPGASELSVVHTGDNPEWEASALQIVTESFLQPRAVLDLDPMTGATTLLKQREVLGHYDPAEFVEHRVWVVADDGVQVPMSVIRRADLPTDGSAPGVLSGYGAYEVPNDPYFSVVRLSMLERGVVVAIGHVRGGGEMGRSWYLGGRFEHKVNSFSDMVACARRLGSDGYVDPARLGITGGSAGGLLVGATLNLAPELFAAAHAAVPFVDALTTILDPSLPLTVGEWEEWGNPLEDPEIYRVMKAYSPYENVRRADYPAILATTSLNDTRVQVGEPLKWVTRLRETVTSDQVQRPIVLKTEMVAGHGGRSGRYDAWRQFAFEEAFMLWHLGVRE